MYHNEIWVYLDHWAVRHFSTAEADRNRLLASLRNNTFILFSGMNAVDLIGNEGASVAEMDRLFHAIGSNWRQLNIAPEAVIERGARLGITPRESALLDLTGDPADSFSLVNWVALQGAARTEARSLAQAMADRVNEWMRTSGALRQLPHALVRNASAVEAVWSLVLEQVLKRGDEMTANDAVDALHCVVPVAVCDFVLLDGHWASIANRIGCPPRRAQVFSRRNHGVAKFLQSLEAVGHRSS